MSEKRGCFKTGCLGCLGLLAVVILFTAIMAGLAWKGLDDQELVEGEYRPDSTMVASGVGALPEDWRSRPGRLILELGQGEFIIQPAPEGEGLSARAQFDSEVHAIEENFSFEPDSTWVYGLRFHRHMPGMQAMFRAILGGDTDARVEVFIPRDVPIVLQLLVEEGGGEAELGGLWLTDAEIRYSKGGFSLNFDEPLREPMRSLSIRGSMGGFEAAGLGHASPSRLEVDCRMGGADVDLDGLWLQDCDVDLKIRMGGMGVRVPRDVNVQGVEVGGSPLDMPDGESPVPTLRMTTDMSMGEIEVIRR